MSTAHDIMPMRQLVHVLMSNALPMRGYSSMPAQQAWTSWATDAVAVIGHRGSSPKFGTVRICSYDAEVQVAACNSDRVDGNRSDADARWGALTPVEVEDEAASAARVAAGRRVAPLRM